MKMVKKILFGALVAVTLTGLVGCKPQAGGNSDMFEVTGKKAVVNYENGKDFTRGFLTLKDKHLDAVCKIETTINPIAAADLANKVANGVTGVIFNYKEDEDKGTASFTIAGIRYNQSTKKVQAYVETFKDVDIDALEDELSGGKAATGLSYDPAKAFGIALDGDYVKDNKLTIWIDIVANDGKTEGRTGDAGTYTVSFYDEDPKRNNAALTNKLTYTGAAAKKSCVIETTEVSCPLGEGTNAKLGNMQADIGFYANIQPNETLNASWTFSEVAKEAEEIAE